MRDESEQRQKSTRDFYLISCHRRFTIGSGVDMKVTHLNVAGARPSKDPVVLEDHDGANEDCFEQIECAVLARTALESVV